MSEVTIFDRILRREIPCNPVYEDDDVLAFHDINPQAPVHVLVIPKARAVAFHDLEQQETAVVGALFQKAAKVAKDLGLGEKGYRIVVNSGRHGQQSVDYLHVHILGGRQLHWPPG
jgi:histidine triad (HIT) family protein